MITIKNLHAYYGTIEALKGISLNIAKGKITCLIGSNGAGKSSLLKSISGACSRTGEILFKGSDIVALTPQKVANLGIAHVPEGRHIFPGLTVKENLEVGTVTWRGFFGNSPYNEELEDVYNLFPRLRERADQLGWSLSGGEQQMLAIGRALMARPEVLLLDEPSMGLAPLVIAELFDKIVDINRKKHLTILLVEQNAKLAMKTADYTYVLERGKITIEGPSEQVRNDARVIQSYLGKFARADRN